jgi:hypothetical protein
MRTLVHSIAHWRTVHASSMGLQLDFASAHTLPDIPVLPCRDLADGAFEHGKESGDGIAGVSTNLLSVAST